MSAHAVRPSDNRLLAALPQEEYARLLPRLELVSLATRATLHEADTPIDRVYFPLTAVASVTTLMADGAMVEVGTIGREGTTGLPAFFGAEVSPLVTFIQVPGDVVRLPLAAFREAAASGTALHALLLRFAQAYYILTAQSAGCNRLHPVEERCARWLLLTEDRAGRGTFPLSHEFLGLHARRAARQRDDGDGRAPAGGAADLPPGDRHDPGPARPGGGELRVLRRHRQGVHHPPCPRLSIPG